VTVKGSGRLSKNNYRYSDFDKYAGAYDKWFDEHPVIFESELHLLQDMNLKGKVLDIGVGTGIFASAIAANKSVVGVGSFMAYAQDSR
jgi:ubiquinone/menaquinone biosynthesis C-methylase UbiE